MNEYITIGIVCVLAAVAWTTFVLVLTGEDDKPHNAYAQAWALLISFGSDPSEKTAAAFIEVCKHLDPTEHRVLRHAVNDELLWYTQQIQRHEHAACRRLYLSRFVRERCLALKVGIVIP